MTITRNHREIVFECDNCMELFESGMEDFGVAYEHAKKAGWRAVKNGEDWEHYCPDCDIKPGWALR